MHALHLPARKVVLDIQAATDEREGDGDGFRVPVRGLSSVCIDDVLVNEGRIRMRERQAGPREQSSAFGRACACSKEATAFPAKAGCSATTHLPRELTRGRIREETKGKPQT